ncbi:MAG: hypothetical protein EOR92_33160 [Mesorhizobium sp.]|nr:MAG: hypothetical protein EOR02_19200 [Mesorhizobium sp.]RWQ12656.1 MAG: hypothetical protein EOR92_33160 [Mesorhizobium sp.]
MTANLTPRGGDARQGRGGRERTPAFVSNCGGLGTCAVTLCNRLIGWRDSAPLWPAGHLPHKGGDRQLQPRRPCPPDSTFCSAAISISTNLVTLGGRKRAAG